MNIDRYILPHLWLLILGCDKLLVITCNDTFKLLDNNGYLFLDVMTSEEHKKINFQCALRSRSRN